MEKITKSTDTVLIDPNEPLILPDGTALVGRIEWFLYALCCLDYQNLPTPMSRIEEFANALITGEIPNIEPQSRAEQFFLAILDGNVSNLPQPQSRSEVLLDKLARGEFDLSDVEPIQSRYELLLAYLIKNGGIGNIDYVLYEFSEAMKTMYNTVEKPFKSLELSGNTLVNCVLEDTENDDYTSFDKDYSGTSFTINGTSEGAIKSAILKGNTLVNLCDKTKSVFSLDGNKNLWQNVLFNTNPTQLTVINHTDKVIKFTLHNRTTDNWVSTTGVEANSKSLVNCGTNNYLKDLYGAYNDGWSNTEEDRNILKDGILILEGDYTNVNIPYFEGMQSVKMPVLTTTNGSANILIGSQLNDMTGEIETSPYGNKMIEDYILIPNADITMSSAQWLKVFFYDENKVYISNTGGGYIDSYVLNSSTIPTNAKYFRYHYSGSSYPVIKFSDGTDYITPTVGSEPYKTNILTTTSKNLFDMNRPYDAITDSQATVVQDTNQITVSSAESGIYVNANFILDKDFFAGKTVTGSCLYESDEKDIGTVQIYYQDGNGEHHYQWIRTPRTFTFPNSFIGDVMLCVSANNTGTPQSNTVTVKNIQLELGSTATSYEPYSEGVTLRGIGDVKDELNLLTGEVVERIGEIVLDGSEEWKTDINGAGVRRYFLEGVGGDLSDSISNSSSLLCDKFKASSNIWTETNDGTQIVKSNGVYFIDSSVDSLDMFVNKLKTTNIKVQYSLIEKPVKTVDLNVVDQNNTKIDKMHVFNEVTHVNASSDGLTPTVNIGKSVSYPTIIKPSTKYTVDLKRNDKPLTVNLGGTEVTFADGETRKIITTPSTLTNDKLSYYGIGAKCNKIMLIEGEVEGNVDYFTGMQSVVMQNQMPILHTVGKNLIDNTSWESGRFDNSTGEVLDNSEFTRYAKYIQVKPSTTYVWKDDTDDFKAIYEYGATKDYIGLYGDTAYTSTSVKFTTSATTKFIRIWIKNTTISSTNQLEESVSATTYEPYKTSILSCNDDVTLRGIGDVKDELDLLTGEMIQRIGEVVLDGSDDEEYSKEITSSGIVRFNFSGNTNNITQKSKPHGQALCDKLITSNKDIDNLDYVKVHSNNGGFWVYQADKDLDANTLKEKLKINPLTIKYQLATESIKTVDSNVVDQDGNTIPKIKSYDGVTHLEVTVPKQSLLPNISAEVATDNSKDMSLLTIKHQEISEAQSTIEDSIQFQSDEIDTALMATTEIFESILE